MPRQKLTELDQTAQVGHRHFYHNFCSFSTNFHPNMDILTKETLAGIVKALEGGSTNHQQFDQKGHVASELLRQLEPEGINKGDGKDRLPPLLSPARHWFWSCKSHPLLSRLQPLHARRTRRALLNWHHPRRREVQGHVCEGGG